MEERSFWGIRLFEIIDVDRFERNMKKILHLLLGLTLAAAVVAAPAEAREGRLDRSFGNSGQVPAKNAIMAVGPQGSILLANTKTVVLLTAEGHRKSLFGRDGSRSVPARAAGWAFRLSDAALDSEGRVLLFGAAFPPGHPAIEDESGLESYAISRAAVLRLLPDGRLDPSFGEGGAVVSDFGLHSEIPEVASQVESTTQIARGAVDSLDRPLFVIGATEGYTPCAGHTFRGFRPSAIVRLTPSGVPDPEFGEGDGLSPTFPKFGGIAPVSLALTNGVQPLMGSALSGGCPEGASVIRLSENGTALPGYGTGGRQNFRKLSFEAFTPDGGAILERRRFQTEEFRRVTPQGQLDPGFGRDGAVTMKIRPDAGPYQAAAVDAKGRTLIVDDYSRPAVGRRAKRAFLVVERLLASGRVDRSFGRDGRITVPVPGAQNIGFLQVALDPEGRLLVLSELTKPNEYPTGVAVLTRFLLG